MSATIQPTISSNFRSINVENNYYLSQEQVRFFRKYYAVVIMQLLTAYAFILYFQYNQPVQIWAGQNIYLLMPAFGMNVITLVTLTTQWRFVREPAWNYLLIILYTIAQTFLEGVLTGESMANEILATLQMIIGYCVILFASTFTTPNYETKTWPIKFPFALSIPVTIAILITYVVHFLVLKTKITCLVKASVTTILSITYLIGVGPINKSTPLIEEFPTKSTICPEDFLWFGGIWCGSAIVSSFFAQYIFS